MPSKLQQASEFVNKVTEDKLTTKEGATNMVMLQALLDLAKPHLKKEAIENVFLIFCCILLRLSLSPSVENRYTQGERRGSTV